MERTSWLSFYYNFRLSVFKKLIKYQRCQLELLLLLRDVFSQAEKVVIQLLDASISPTLIDGLRHSYSLAGAQL